jgi:hypothetical protein
MRSMGYVRYQIIIIHVDRALSKVDEIHAE